MRKVLEADDDSVLVYVAPTKALVNQIAAEIQARYSKRFKHGGHSVWAIATKDYRINNPTGCQVLVTVPHILQIMLLSPSNARSWSTRVKRIIFDEVHSIGQAEDGVVWEQLLLMAPCPIIALSATVDNPDEFSAWLGSTQHAMGHTLTTVKHLHRYSDLRKFFYVAPVNSEFEGLPKRQTLSQLGLEGSKYLRFIHPVAALVDRTRGLPEDFALEPRDCLLLWQAMTKVQTKEYQVPSALDPRVCLPDLCTKKDVLRWEQDLKALLRNWLDDRQSPYCTLVSELTQDCFMSNVQHIATAALSASSNPKNLTPGEEFIKSTLPLLSALHEQDALPAIIFNYDRTQCEDICRSIVDQLKAAEVSQVKSGSGWNEKVDKFEDWLKMKEKLNAKASKTKQKESSKKTKKGGSDEQDSDRNKGMEKTSKLDLERATAADTPHEFESFDPEAPCEGYHIADFTKAQPSELAEYARQLRKHEVPHWLIDALGRGVGVHHAGMNRKYRQVVEILFRKRFLRVVIATGTLALGIDMPCKTVVFAGDSVYLTALQYRQCAGRSGRRGFDLLGNVVFHGISSQKVCRLLSSRLPDLNGHFPITTTLFLRLFGLLHESNQAKYAINAINALLAQPRLYLGGDSFKDQTMHHLRFSNEYLRRQQLLTSGGVPLNFAGMVNHLYYIENSAFAFHALLKEGYFHSVCSDISTSEENTLLRLMLVLAHIFKRVPCSQAIKEHYEDIVKPSSSIVFLPPLPNEAATILRNHNQQTLEVYKTYVKTFVKQHVGQTDNRLPLTGIVCGGENNAADTASGKDKKIRSSFVALSGAGDQFDSIHDLCSTVRSGVFLEEAVVPYIPLSDELDTPLNAWLLDFFKHGDVHALAHATFIRKADIWFLLKDFSLILATIVTGLTNFLKLGDGTDLEMLEVCDALEQREAQMEENIAAAEAPKTAEQKPNVKTQSRSTVADSWEEEDLEATSNGDKIRGAADRQTGTATKQVSASNEDEGLLNILLAFKKLQVAFDDKFRAMWA